MSETTSSRRLGSPYTAVIRPVRGFGDLAVVTEQGKAGLSLLVWHGSSGELERLDFSQADYETTLTPDGRHILSLDDPTGSEVAHLHAFSRETGDALDLTPGLPDYTVRGLDCAVDSDTILITGANDDGFFALLTGVRDPDRARVIFRSPNETWSGILSADAQLAALETTDHNPGVRRFAVTVVDIATEEVIAVLSDGPLGPIRPVRFAQEPGDARLLAYTEASGYARPLVWNPLTGGRVDVHLPDLTGDVFPLDWHSPSGRLLLVHVDKGIHRVLEHTLVSDRTVALDHPPGSYFEPDVGATFPVMWASYYSRDGARRLLHSTWNTPLHVLESRGSESPTVALPPSPVPAGATFLSHTLQSHDGTQLQLWVGVPADPDHVRGTILEVHGGPNLVTVDRYDALAQAFVDAGWRYASLNYRGSVTFGREFREKYWGRVGEGEIDDIAAAVSWLEQHKLATRDSLFITGPSYGGFLTLMAVGKLPDHFAGGLAHVAQADWVAAYRQMNPAIKAAWVGFIGTNPDDDVDAWVRASPMSYVDSVRSPVWLNQGEFDTRTPPEQAQRYADALRGAGGDVLLEWFSGGHMPGGLAGMSHDFHRMIQLLDRRLRSERWDTVVD